MEQIIIQQKIHEFRGQRVILDYDLAPVLSLEITVNLSTH